jgi:HK97 gp10 family phage protein
MAKNVELKGYDELLAMMKQLPESVSVKVIRSAERQALKPALQAMRQNAASRTGVVTGRYRRSIGIKLLRGSSTRVATLAGVRYGGTLGAPHAHLVEKGTVHRKLKTPRTVTFTTKAGATITSQVSHTGRVQARNVIADAIRSTETQVLNGFAVSLQKALVTTMRRYAKKYA